MDIPGAWDALLRRKVFLVGTLAFSLPDEPVQCDPIADHTASLVLIDLMSVFDEAATDRLAMLSIDDPGSLHRRIDALAAAGELQDPAGMHSLRERRNRLAHDLDRIKWNELDAGLLSVHRELSGWQMVPPLPNYIPFFDTSLWRKVDSPSGAYYERDYSIGVQIAQTGEPVLQYRFLERVDDIAKPMSKIRLALNPIDR